LIITAPTMAVMADGVMGSAMAADFTLTAALVLALTIGEGITGLTLHRELLCALRDGVNTNAPTFKWAGECMILFNVSKKAAVPYTNR
jgi:hypothetical protein